MLLLMIFFIIILAFHHKTFYASPYNTWTLYISSVCFDVAAFLFWHGMCCAVVNDKFYSVYSFELCNEFSFRYKYLNIFISFAFCQRLFEITCDVAKREKRVKRVKREKIPYINTVKDEPSVFQCRKIFPRLHFELCASGFGISNL